MILWIIFHLKLLYLLINIKLFGINKCIQNIIEFIIFGGPIFVKISQNLIYKKNIPIVLKKKLIEFNNRTIHTNLSLPIIPPQFKFKDINKPLAVGSIATVWEGTWNNNKAIIKIVDDNIKNKLDRSKYLFNILLWWLNLFNNKINILDTFEKKYIYKQMYSGINMNIESKNLYKFKKLFKPFQEFIKIPNIYYYNQNIIIESKEEGMHIEKFKKIYPDKLNFVINIIQAMFYKMFFDNFLHADIHPANFLISLNKSDKPYIILFDFGLVESFDEIFFPKLIYLFQKNIFFPDLYKTIKILSEINISERGKIKLFTKQSYKYLDKIDLNKQYHMMLYGTNDNVKIIPLSVIIKNILNIASINFIKFPGNILILLNTFILVDDYRSIYYGNAISWKNRLKFIKNTGFYSNYENNIKKYL